MQFKFIINDSKYNIYKKITSSLLLLNALLFAFIAIQAVSISSLFIFFIAALVLAAYSIYFLKYKKQKEKSFIIAYLFAAIIWITQTPSWYFAIVFLVLLFIQLRLENDSTISISTAGISVDSFLKSNYEWSAVNNAVLKDGLLTLDFTNNKILQVEPDLQLNVIEKEYAVLEKEFNDFCRQQLMK